MEFRTTHVKGIKLSIPCTGSPTAALIVRHGLDNLETLKSLQTGSGAVYGAFVVWCARLRSIALQAGATTAFDPIDVFQALVCAFLSGSSWRATLREHQHRVYRKNEPLTLVRGRSRKGVLRTASFRLPTDQCTGRTGKDKRGYSGKPTSLDRFRKLPGNTRAAIKHRLLVRWAGRTVQESTRGKHARSMVDHAAKLQGC